MAEVASEKITVDGETGRLVGRRWQRDDPSWIAVLVHGYGEHIGRYGWVADELTRAGAAVYGVDHLGHGESPGERVLITDFEPVVADVHRLDALARAEHPGLPVVMIGHSMGGMIGARYAQRFGSDLAAVVLSGPVIGRWDAVTQLLAAEVIPDDPIDVATLSRDPEVGAAYESDDLVWHGPFKRPTLQALQNEITLINGSGAITDVPVIWLHGEEDPLVPIEASRGGWAVLAGDGSDTEQKSYPGARHEIFNETNKDEVLGDALAFVAKHVDGVRR